MEDSKKPKLLEALFVDPPAEKLPLAYQLIAPREGPAPLYASAQSDHHRARGFFCYPFYKHIARCFGR
jgi:hypothetical protein